MKKMEARLGKVRRHSDGRTLLICSEIIAMIKFQIAAHGSGRCFHCVAV
jgi:hypothetical protein